MIYILRLDEPLGTPRHFARFYVGYCEDGRLDTRLAEHRSGFGSAFTRCANERGIGYSVIFTCNGDRVTEKQIKRWKNTAKFLRSRGVLL